jgi:hypothetical protein
LFWFYAAQRIDKCDVLFCDGSLEAIFTDYLVAISGLLESLQAFERNGRGTAEVTSLDSPGVEDFVVWDADCDIHNALAFLSQD